MQIRILSSLKDLDHETGIDHTDQLSEVWSSWMPNLRVLGPFFGPPKGSTALLHEPEPTLRDSLYVANHRGGSWM